MTLEEARTKLIAKYDEAAARLRAAVTTPAVTNLEWFEIKDANKAMNEAVRELFQLNALIDAVSK